MYAKRHLLGKIMPMKEKMRRWKLLHARPLVRSTTRVPRPLRSTKQALLVGINYQGSSSALYGCINDTVSMKERLLSKGFVCKTITDETDVKPTRMNILNAFKQLLMNAVDGDQLFFLYSGHGTSISDQSGDEIDRKDEAIIPSDKKRILDDELKSLLRYVKKGVTLFAMFDSCNSGTVLDLKYNYMDRITGGNTVTTNSETIGKVYMLSGCRDNQTSADAFIQNKSQGAMTWSLLESLKTITTWRQLLQSMRNLLKKDGYSQVPQLSSGKALNLDTPVYI